MPTNHQEPQGMSGWMRSIEKRLQRQERRLGSGPIHGTITGEGSPVIIRDPVELLIPQFINTDRYTTLGAGNVRMRLTHLPKVGSEHVTWHPNSGGGLHLTTADWSRSGQLLTIPTFPGLAAGDLITCEYAYTEAAAGSPIDPLLVGTSAASGGAPGYTMSIPLPAGTQEGDFIVIAARGSVAPGGGDVATGFSTADSRMGTQYAVSAPPVAEAIFTGFATSSSADVVLNIIPNPSYSGGGYAVMAVFRGVNAVGDMSVANTGVINGTHPTPRVAGTAAVAVTWSGNDSFGIFASSTPDNYTFACYTGLLYGTTTISYWSDPAAHTSPAGNYVNCEGCCVFALT